MTKTPTPIDTSAGTAAYALAILHQADIQPRLPAGTLTGLAADLTLLGAAPASTTAPTPVTPPAAPAPTPPSLVDATASAVALITAIHAAVVGAAPSATVR